MKRWKKRGIGIFFQIDVRDRDVLGDIDGEIHRTKLEFHDF